MIARDERKSRVRLRHGQHASDAAPGREKNGEIRFQLLIHHNVNSLSATSVSAVHKFFVFVFFSGGGTMSKAGAPGRFPLGNYK